jgi:predicted DNA-binding transcriptional regulator YafY
MSRTTGGAKRSSQLTFRRRLLLVRLLLRYGDACHVVEPAELVVLFRKTAEGLAQYYGTQQEQTTDS